ncbi:hypothetical protein [Streptomyces endophytica]|uniref:Uncharacterized protein n=1 Tax=Streptomyces endophytica TaxID=2991496 RepID=A0ABY6PFC6_9ACTN|nr:hypothetical protein [Streptomyces endophytica]UZJ32579.1 hypothetical protein OJ254_22700 [Streptomyces endophytica]
MIAAIAHHCGTTPHKLNELLRLWTAATTAAPRETEHGGGHGKWVQVHNGQHYYIKQVTC